MPNSTTHPSSPFYIYTGPSQNNISPNYTPQPEQPPMPTWVNPYRFARINRDNERRWYPKPYDSATEWGILVQIAEVLRTASIINREYTEYGRGDNHFKFAYDGRYAHFTREDAAEHAWHGNLQQRFNLHPAIKDAVRYAPPDDRHLLILEWPHVSETDPNRLAYTRDERGGREDRQVITSVGKYLRRHFSRLSDNQIRDITMRYGNFKFELWDTQAKIVSSVQDGPQSCMKWDDHDSDSPSHPYNVYAPEFGWRAAVRLDGNGKIVGRCLVNVEPTPHIFVRSYAHKLDGYSHSDEALEVWLRDQGYVKADNWNGLKLRKLKRGRYGDEFLAPYLDGNDKCVDDCGDYLLITSDGEYICEHTDGTAHGNSHYCPSCDRRVHEDDLTSIGYHGDEQVCDGCIGEYYTHVYGRRGNQYYVHSDNAVYCEYDDEWYDCDYLSDNNIIELHNGDICPEDQAVYLEGREEWWHNEDEDIIYCEHDDCNEHMDDVVCLEDGTYAHTDNTWHCTVSGNYYHNDDDNKRVEFCDVETQMHHTAHEDAVEEYYYPDLEDIIDAIADMTFA